MAQTKDLYDFLVEAELEHYYNALKNDLKINNIPQLKYVEDEDLTDVGMTKPEMRRLKKFFKKECPQTTFSKLKKILTTKGSPEGQGSVTPGTPPPERSPGPLRTASKHIIPEDAISLCKTLGTGEFGTVQQGVWTNEDGDRVQVAVKCLCKEKMQSGTSDFLKEATIMHGIDHEHIVRLYGVVLGSDNLMLVTELAPLRSLLECIKEPALRASFPLLQLCDFAVQIAQGMSYLESKRLIHRDLSARNILVFAKDKVKVSDFGLSRALGVGSDYYQTNFNVNLKLPIAWCAPECINYLKFTSASDIWAYGVTLWEMFSYGFQPWAAFTGQQILEAIDEPNFQRLERPECCSRDYYSIMRKCWEHEPEKRPSFQELSQMLPQIKPEQVAAVKDYPDAVPKKDYIFYRVHDIITVLDKKPNSAPEEGLWKGATDGSKTGFFNPADTVPYIEINMSPGHKTRAKISRKESARKSSRGSVPPVTKKLHAGMIGRPQNDLRHTGHIGYDGAVFGDVSFIGDNYDKLPVKVVTPCEYHNRNTDCPQEDMLTDEELDKAKNGQSESSLLSGSKSKGSSLTAISLTSDGDTLTDVSSFHGDSDSFFKSSPDKPRPRTNDFDDFDSFKMPDFSVTSSSLDFDLGPSFMDEVMKAIAEPKDEEKPPGRQADKEEEEEERGEKMIYQNERVPLVEKPFVEKPQQPALPPRKAGKPAAFENMALTVEVEQRPVPAVRKNPDRDSLGDYENPVNEDMFLDPSPSASSPDIWDDQPEWNSRIEHVEKKKTKPLLKLADEEPEFIPSRDSNNKDSGGVKPMSASDEKKLDRAIELANEFAELNASQHMMSSPVSAEITPAAENGVDSSPTRKTLFGSRKKNPEVERRSFSDEMATLTDTNEEVPPEAQAAYNVLVAKGSTSEDELPYKQMRDWRLRRAMQHQSTEQSDNGAVARNGRPVNKNIRKPAGIPGRAPNVTEEGEVDTNPLRRLRESQSLIKPRFPGRGSTSEAVANGRSNEHIRKPNLNANLPFFAKLKEQEQLQGNGSDEEEGSLETVMKLDL